MSFQKTHTSIPSLGAALNSESEIESSSAVSAVKRQAGTEPLDPRRRKAIKVASSALAIAAFPAFVRAQTDSIKIGMSCITTGRFAYNGIGQIAAVKLAFAKANARGGIGGRKLELVTRDSRNLPEEAVKNVRSLINSDKCTIIISGESSSSALAINEGLRDTKVACLQVTSEVSSLTADPKRFNPLIFRVARQGIHDAIAGADFASKVAKQKGIDKWATCSPDFAFGRDTTEQFIEYMRVFGAKVDLVAQVWPKFGQPDFTEVVTKMLSSAPQAIYSLCFGGDLLSLVEQANLYGLFEKRIAMLPLYSDYGVVDVIKRQPRDVIVQNRYNWSYPATAQNRAWYDDFMKLGAAKPTNFTWQAHAAAQFVVDGLTSTGGDTDPEKFAKAIRGSSAEVPYGLNGKVTLRAQDNTLVEYPLAYGTAISAEPFVKDWNTADWKLILEQEAIWKKKQGYA